MKIPAIFPVLVMGLSSFFVSQQAMAHAHLKTAVPADKAELRKVRISRSFLPKLTR